VLIFYPLLIVCIALFLIALIFRANLVNPSKETFIKFLILLCLLSFVFIYIGLSFLINLAYFLFIISIFSFILITSLFFMHSFYEKGVKLDDKIRKIPKKNLKFILRLAIFLVSIFFAVLVILIVISLGGGTGEISSNISSKELSYMIDMLPYILIYVYIGLGVLALIIAIKGKFNAWLGIFFLITALFAGTVLIDAFQTAGDENQILSGPIGTIIVFSFDSFLVLFTISGLIGEKLEIIEKKLKIIKYDALIVWLIFSKAAFEFAEVTLEGAAILGAEVSLLKTLGVFLLFIPLLIIMTLNGIKKYSKKK
ncbi:MAG: hypothetical protein ACTSQG_09290, partial [Promethearchaeota archaeon]